MFKSMGNALARAVIGAWQAWRWLAQALLGAWTWDAPPWVAAARRRPVPVMIILGVSLASIAGGAALWRWYERFPKPELAGFSIGAPGRTRIEVDGAKPEPLVIRFDRSAAALALAGKELSRGIALEPKLQGTWRWADDRTLEFRVGADWPIGQRYVVTVDKALFGPHIRLASSTFRFTTAPFEAQVATTLLYQDPIHPGVKQGVFDVHFSHPVDVQEFEKRVELQLAGQRKGVLGVGRETLPFTVVYDKLRLTASVHSGSLTIPKDPTELNLALRAGIRAAKGGNRTTSPLSATVHVPGVYSLTVDALEPLVVDNDRNEPEQILLLSLSAATGEREVAGALHAWLLPAIRPSHGAWPAAGTDEAPYGWVDPREVTSDVLKRAEEIPLEAVAQEREFTESHSVRYHADVGRYLLVQVDKDLRSFGGYLAPAPVRFIVRVPPFPAQLKILSQGSLLALSGEHKVVAMVRDLPGMRVDIGRVFPDQLQHLISQSAGDFANPAFNGDFGPDNVTERFEVKIPLGNAARGRTHYEPIDLAPYLSAGGERRGLFLLTVRGYDPKAEAKAKLAAARAAAAAAGPTAPGPDDATQAADDSDADPGTMEDKRLILVTDLGLLEKRSADGAQDVFVQSIQTGAPVGGATVQIVAKNGAILFSQMTDAAGRAHFPRLDGLNRERTPLFVQAGKGGDMSFLPMNRGDRTLDYSRFDIGGIRSARTTNEIRAYLFSDRGLYRPGETLHVGAIVKAADWMQQLAGVPLEYDLLDGRGLTVKRARIFLPADGFAEFEYATKDTSPTGAYTLNLYIVKDGLIGGLLGTTSVRVQEFEPDRMKVAAHLSAESVEGWVSPKDLRARINVQNLFGTPAAERRIEATLTLTPAYPSFRRFPEFRFYDPLRAKDGYTDKIKDSRTDANGDAGFDLGLEKYARATYRVHLLARAFEPDGGRSVSADAAVLVSEMPFLVGFKADGDLGFVSRGGSRQVTLMAIDPTVAPIAVTGLCMTHVEIHHVSVLTRQSNGTYKYESHKKETTLDAAPLSLVAAGQSVKLATEAPGSFAYVIRDAAGLELNRIEYSVAGQGNVSRTLEREAELQISLDKKDYSPGDLILLNIKAPYTGSGLITIERDHVYATQWFKSTTTASVHSIRLPADFEGNGYVTVQFIRDPASDEIFTSPLSYGVAPFMTSLARRTNELTLTAAALTKPGEPLRITLRSARPARAVVFAVDEGILQVAHHPTPDPLGEFFKKRALEVRTSQILDLILPEFQRVLSAAAPGGDGEAALRRNLNPFKRKGDKPAVYWSGIVDAGRVGEFSWVVPDTFNGSLKIFAVAVDAGTVGVAEATTTVRGDFVLTPNMPVAVAPGDEFDVSVGVANNVEGSGDLDVVLRAEPSTQLEALGADTKTLKIAAMHEAAAVWRFRARARLGSADVKFTAVSGPHTAQLSSSLSVRPASPYNVDVMAGTFASAAEVAIPRSLFAEHRKLRLGVSASPLVLAGALTEYLDSYPHLCTEQLVSRAFPALIAQRQPELSAAPAAHPNPGEATAALVSVLRSRQNAEGGFGLWAASVEPDELASVYAIHWMMEAREQGEAVPDDMLQHGLAWLRQYAASPVGDDPAMGLRELRNRAYAAYLLTRQGTVTTPIIAGLRDRLDARYSRLWRDDVAAAYLAAVYQMQKQDREAAALIAHSSALLAPSATAEIAGQQRFTRFYDDSARDAQILYLLARHFPARARALHPDTLRALVSPLARGEYSTFSSAFLVLAFDAYATAVPGNALANFTAAESSGGKHTPLALEGHLVLRAEYGGEAKSLHLTNAGGLAGFYAVTNAGFDTVPPADMLQQGMEITRDYLDDRGQSVTRVKTGDELTVRLRMRAINLDYIPNVAVTDLLPGGFEPVLQSTASTDRLSAGPATGWRPMNVDLREDRVVLYGTFTRDMAEYDYRIRATNPGVFKIPPAYAESMYDRRLRARALPGSMSVEAPESPARPDGH